VAIQGAALRHGVMTEMRIGSGSLSASISSQVSDTLKGLNRFSLAQLKII
jgi:hypothetical protein